MRLKITLAPTKDSILTVPVHYHYGIEAFIYNVLSKQIASKLHEEGFTYEKRHFKLFVFSNIATKGVVKNKMIVFNKPISFYFSTPIRDVWFDEVNNLLTKKELVLYHQPVVVSSLETIKSPLFKEKMIIKMLSPIVIYSTFKDPKGVNKTHYYMPYEKEFSPLIEKNAKKKYKLLYGKTIDGHLSVKPYKFSENKNKTVTYVKKTVVIAYSGLYELSGNIDLIKTTYYVGLGSKNPSGFGMWREYELL